MIGNYTDSEIEKELELYERITFNLDSNQYFNQIPILSKYVEGPDVLDLGCGPVLHNVGLAYQSAKNILGCDLIAKNLEFIEAQLAKKQMSEKQTRIVNYVRNLSKQKIEDINLNSTWNNFKKSIKLQQQDARDFNPQLAGKFNTVIQCGLIGCFTSKDEIQKTACHIYRYLKPNGVTVWINWTRNSTSTGNPLYSGAEMAEKLTIDLYQEFLENSGFKIEELTETANIRPVSLERGHRSVIWAVARK